MKDHRHNARIHDVRHLGCSPSSEAASAVVGMGHPSLDRAMARAAARNAAHPPVSALRAACLTTFGTPIPVVTESSARTGGRPLDGVCVTASRHDARSRVVHVATVRDVAKGDRWYRIRTWHELSAVSAN